MKKENWNRLKARKVRKNKNSTLTTMVMANQMRLTRIPIWRALVSP